MAGRRAKQPDASAPQADAGMWDEGRVRAVLMLNGMPWDHLDDGVQQVRLKLLEEQKKDPSRIRHPSAWLSVVASRVAIDWQRNRVKEANLRERLTTHWSQQSRIEHSEEHRLLALVVAEGLEALPPTQRQILTLRFYADLSVPEIARLLHLPLGTAKSRLHTAITSLRKRLLEGQVL